MNSENALEAITQVIRQLSEEQDQPIDHDTRLNEDLGLDSLSQIEVITSVEKLLSLTVPDDQVAKIRTVGDIVTVVLALSR
ncbi:MULTISPECIES: acyl carrier protein [unclassified Streptomyces]|uniref:acyl carrier protein n=1 Tax=unclassified Streptomyces TaxID=2593676 RepID=UPI0022536CBB|nr:MULTISPECIES: acyl carrier protein [unclassified Streptomyces]MCX5053058.1 acyl carrier protein [Streptomyces sp. NBC_00474]